MPRLILPGKLEKGRKKTARSDLNELFLHPPRTCYWHRVASMEAVRGGPGERDTLEELKHPLLEWYNKTD